MNETQASITNCRKNIMGTVSFMGKFRGMRKAQDFIVYPMQDSGEIIDIQSDNRYGKLHLVTGVLLLSGTHSHANDWKLQLDVRDKRATKETLPQEEVQTLRQWIKSTGGIEVGSRGVVSDNTGAMAL